MLLSPLPFWLGEQYPESGRPDMREHSEDTINTSCLALRFCSSDSVAPDSVLSYFVSPDCCKLPSVCTPYFHRIEPCCAQLHKDLQSIDITTAHPFQDALPLEVSMDGKRWFPVATLPKQTRINSWRGFQVTRSTPRHFPFSFSH